MGLVVPHQSGARVVVHELAIAHSDPLTDGAPWRCTVDARVDRGEGDQHAAWTWFDNGVLERSVEEIVGAVSSLALDGSTVMPKPRGTVDDDGVAARDSHRPRVREVRVRFGIDGKPDAALAKFAVHGDHVLPGVFHYDAPTLLRVHLVGEAIRGPRNPQGWTRSMLTLCACLEAPGNAALRTFIESAVGRVHYNELALPIP